FAVHAKDVDVPFAVFRTVLPRNLGRLYPTDAGCFEELAGIVLRVVAPHLYVVGREGERLHPAVAHGVSVCRLVALEDDLPPLFDRPDQRMDVGGMASADDGLGQRFVVVDRVELAFEVLFEQIRVVYALDRPPQNDGFLFGEMYELRNLPEMR